MRENAQRQTCASGDSQQRGRGGQECLKVRMQVPAWYRLDALMRSVQSEFNIHYLNRNCLLVQKIASLRLLFDSQPAAADSILFDSEARATARLGHLWLIAILISNQPAAWRADSHSAVRPHGC